MDREYKRNALHGVGVAIAGSEERDGPIFDDLRGSGAIVDDVSERLPHNDGVPCSNQGVATIFNYISLT